MNQLIDELNNVKSTSERLKMYYLTKTKRRSTDNEYLAFGVPISASIRTEIKDLLLDDTIAKMTDKSLIPFNPTCTDIGTIETLPVEQVNNYDKIYEAISTTLPESLDELEFGEIWGYCIIIKYNNTNPRDIIFFKKFSYPKLLAKSLVLSLVNGTYNKIIDEVVTVDTDLHAFVVNSNAYILNKAQFEKFFNFSSSYQQIVQTSFDSLQALNVIANFSEFTQSCIESDTLTRRLVKIINDGRFETVQRCIAKVPEVISGYSLNVRFENNKIVFDGNSSISDIITLIKGACVVGALDDEKYIATDTKSVSNS